MTISVKLENEKVQDVSEIPYRMGEVKYRGQGARYDSKLQIRQRVHWRE